MLIKNVSLDLIVTQFASHGAAIWRQKDGMRPKPVTSASGLL